ncbi:MAG: 50S ribosomal protein L9 [Acidobacteria bacterium]|nr:MAG: 50S ribosomal protein L9 [Acidobacteriota bacterium]REK10424.1 MAG: 50S ribosomal protein L9 [Acidobacteriota bacterium]
MQVIMLSDLRHTGRRGEVVDVKPGYARNYLFPRQLAAPATAGNVAQFEQQRAKIEARLNEERQAAAEIGAKLEGLRIELVKRASENQTLYGSVTPIDIQEALDAKGFEIDRRMIDLAGGIKTLGEHEVRIDLHPDVVAQITVAVAAEATA